MIYILSSLLTGGVLTAVCWPLFSKDDSVESAILEETEWDLVQRKKEIILGNIQDLDFDYSCGKLSEEDYTNLRREMSGEAGVVLNKIDNLEASYDLDVLIRHEVAIRKDKFAEKKACSSCGHLNLAVNNYCAECGTELGSS